MSSASTDADACPNCGTRVESNMTYGIGAGTPPETTQQQNDCPKCGSKLRRAAGGSWSLDTRAWSVGVSGTPHDQIVTALINAGMLTHSQNVTMGEGGLGPGRYDGKVSATTVDDARSQVEVVLRGTDAVIESVEPL